MFVLAVTWPTKTGAAVATPAFKVVAYTVSPIFNNDPIEPANSIIVAVFGPLTPVHAPIPFADLCEKLTVPAFVLIKLNHSPSFSTK